MAIRMRFEDGNQKVLTLSYDDGVVQDIRLIEILNKYGIKGTFNVNSGQFIPENTVRDKFYGTMKLSEAKQLYINSGHEVAVHTYSHPYIAEFKDHEVIFEVMKDRYAIENEFGCIARGMAYPYGCFNDRIVELLKDCGIVYSRTVISTERFELPDDWLRLEATCHQCNPRLMELAKEFAELKPINETCKMFYLWGHSYELDDKNYWDKIEDFAKFIGKRDDIWYATNIEVYDYIKAYDNLQISADSKRIYNPSAIKVWFCADKVLYCINPGETLNI